VVCINWTFEVHAWNAMLTILDYGTTQGYIFERLINYADRIFGVRVRIQALSLYSDPEYSFL
jgi:hypothetical protein